MSKKTAQIIVMIFIGLMFIATIIITIMFKPLSNETDSADSSELSSVVTSSTAMINT